MSRAFVCVLDGVGAGALPDAAAFGDEGTDTLGHVVAVSGVPLPHLTALGLGEITGLPLGAPEPGATYGRLLETAPGKDTTTGHWEMMGLILERPFPTYPHGFPAEVLAPFEVAIGRRVLANRPASGTEIIAELGEEHMRSGRPIVYTSADSVFQIACHEVVVPLERLYEWCETARAILSGPHAVGRVIARPFVGAPGDFRRTPNRRDYSLPPPGPTYLDFLAEAGIAVIGVGKIGEIFVQRGIRESHHIESNADGLATSLRLLGQLDRGFLFTNLVDFDSTWGHRNDVEGFARALAEVDAAVPAIRAALRPGDLFVFTADHGVDPTTPGTDHTREYAPLMALGLRGGRYDGRQEDVGATVYRHLAGMEPSLAGRVIP